jgi:hypothetical protein
MIKTTFLVLAALTALPLHAQSVEDCDWRAEARNIAEPWEQNSRVFANGAVRVSLLDTIEPAAVPFFLLVISPPVDEIGSPQCKIIGFGEAQGFAHIEFTTLDANYDPARGLTFQVMTHIYVPEQDFSNAGILEFTLNQSTGAIATEFFPGGE